MWFKVVCTGMSGGGARRSADDAWRVFEWHARRLGYGDCEMSTAKAAHNARLVEGTTRGAVMDADASSSRGEFGRGEWWMSDV